jgi:hypothetical protein
MKIKSLIFAMASLWGVTAYGQTTTLKFNELPDPNKPVIADWNRFEKGINVSFASTDIRFTKSAVPSFSPYFTTQLSAWKGETVSAQIAIWTRQNLENLSVELTDFTGKAGIIKSSNANARFVRYVMTDVFGSGCGARKPGDYPSSLAADMLDNLNSFDVEAFSLRPVWISVDVPRNSKAGDYSSTIKVKAGKQVLQTLRLNLDVKNQVLPEAKDWVFHLDLWQHPAAVARVNGLKMWSDEHFAAIKPVMKRLADAGQKVITTTLNKDPWNVQTYDPYADMIIWTKKKDGTWQYDYKVFDRYVQLMLGLGVNKMINCYSIIPWNNQIHYFDEETQKLIDVETKPGSALFTEYWGPFLKDFYQHLKAKNWHKITNIAMDERSRAQMDAAFALMKEVAPDLGIAYADNQKTYKRYPNSNDISIAIGHPYDKADLIDRRNRKLSSTFYICCTDSFPNTLTFSEPAEATYLGWYAMATGFDGLLRWSYNSWVANPLTDSRFRTWPAGDTYIVYPQNRSSIRFERMREGIQDYEKLRIIRAFLQAKGKTDDLAKLDAALAKLGSNTRTADWNKNLNEAKALLNSF